MFDNYEKIRKIGSGSFGEVFEVRRIDSGEQFAVKKIPIGKNTKSSADNQIKSLSKMKHPNIIQIYEYFYEEDDQKQLCLYLILQFCRNEDLLAHFAKNRKNFISVQKQATSIFKQIVSGCVALHQKGIIHRDLKPQNVLLNGNVVKIADFGCAKILQKHLKSSKMTYNIGTPIYSAPEVFNQWKYDQRCDVWSAGVILYFMIYGTVPFFEKSVPRLKSLVESKTKSQQLQLPNFPQVSIQMSELIRGMLKYDQEQRLVWGQITHSRIFHSPISDIQAYISYLLEINKVLAWLLQSLISFSEYYSFNRLSRLTVLYNKFMESNMDLAYSILSKGIETKLYFKANKLIEHHFSKEAFDNFKDAKQKFSHYIQVMSTKFADVSCIKPHRSGRYHLWYAQQQARIIAANNNAPNQSTSFKRSLYCLFILAGFDRFLGEQHYLSLQSSEFIERIKLMSSAEVENKIKVQMQRIV